MRLAPRLVWGLLSVGASRTVHDIPQSATRVPGGNGWAWLEGYAARVDNCVILGLAATDGIRQYLVRRSIASYW